MEVLFVQTLRSGQEKTYQELAKSLTEYLKPIADEDHVTLLTCTPYGINSHRLLVRGIRTKYIPKHKAMITKKTWPKEIIILLVLTGALVLMIGYKIVKKVRSRKNETKIS